MSLDLYRVALGLEIEDSAAILAGTGAPGGDAAEQDAAAVGSLFLRDDPDVSGLQAYVKTTNINNTAADWAAQASKNYVDTAVQGLSWREPVILRDGVSASLADAVIDANADDLIDGVTLVDGARVLFTGFTADTNNVYVVSGSSGNWALTEAPNTVSDGDALFVQEGTSADQQWIYDGTNWVQFGGSSATELGFIRDFIGKTTAGAILPTYASTLNIVQNSNLTVTISELDAALGDRTYTEQNFVTNAEALAVSVDQLDQFLQDAFDAIGPRTYTEQNFVTDAETLTASVDALDVALADIVGLVQTEQTGVVGATTIDSVLVDEVEAIKWHIVIINETTPSVKRALELYAAHDGTIAADATTVDFNRSSVLRLNGGGGFGGLSITADISGAGATQEMQLRVSSGNPVTVKATRITVV